MGRALKVCVAGPAGGGKTYLCRLLGGQSPPEEGYAPTAGVRIQQVDHAFKTTKVPVDLWDCAGGEENLRCANVLSAGIDALVLVYDAARGAAQEKELERAFQLFAQPHTLVNQQGLLLGIQVGAGEGGEAGSEGRGEKVQGKLGVLQQVFLTLPGRGAPESQRRMAADMARSHLGRLLDKVYRLKRSQRATQDGAGGLEGSL